MYLMIISWIYFWEDMTFIPQHGSILVRGASEPSGMCSRYQHTEQHVNRQVIDAGCHHIYISWDAVRDTMGSTASSCFVGLEPTRVFNRRWDLRVSYANSSPKPVKIGSFKGVIFFGHRRSAVTHFHFRLMPTQTHHPGPPMQSSAV